MQSRLRWTAWNLTPEGWQAGPTVARATDAVQSRPPGTLLSLLAMEKPDEPDQPPTVGVLFRSSDNHAVAAAIAKFGERPMG